VETAGRLPSFRDAFRVRRCIVPADGFYEWHEEEGRRLPNWYHHADDSLLLMAGLFTSALRPAFTILTMPANDVVAPAHDRMPVVLPPDAARAWLDDPRFDPTVRATWTAFGHGLLATPVSSRVSSTAHDGPECLLPPQAPEPPRQLRLLD
jgi:putative SOS response-associated peptidase YedK